MVSGGKKDSGVRPFWDVLVLTTIDTLQQEAFQLQIEEKSQRGELPVDLDIHVICDPPGVRIGELVGRWVSHNMVLFPNTVLVEYAMICSVLQWFPKWGPLLPEGPRAESRGPQSFSQLSGVLGLFKKKTLRIIQFSLRM